MDILRGLVQHLQGEVLRLPGFERRRNNNTIWRERPPGGKQLRVDVARHRDGMWAHVNPDWPAFASPNYDGWARDRSQAWVGIAEASARPTHVRLVHRTDVGAYDIYIDGVLSASSVRTPATRGLKALPKKK